MASPTKKLILIIILSIVATYISLPPQFNFIGKVVTRPSMNFSIGKLVLQNNFDLHLGLDLAGGSHLVFEADTQNLPEEKRKTAIEGVREVIDRRVNFFGVSEPVVQTSSYEGKDKIIVELPGISDTKEATNLIGKTAQLVFSEVIFTSVEENATPSGTLLPTDLTGSDLENAEITFETENGQPAISLKFSQEGAKKFEDITSRNIGKPVVIILDDQILSQPTVQEKIIGGEAQISGDFTVEQAKELVVQLNAGALPIPITLIEERTVGATLGMESIQKSVTAGVVGIILVGAFMILAYGKLGLIANIGLFIFAMITLALYKLIPVTLTLPGIAGFILSVGMAVDSNILIFERFKEERIKRSISDALEVSFGRAWDSIRDANTATLVTAFILANPLDWKFLNISGPVRGFAITLALGILISLFTGIFVSRNLLRVFVKENKKKEKIK